MNEWNATMNENEIAELYNINANEFADYLKRKNLPHEVSLFNGVAVPRHLVDEYVRSFLEDKYLREQEEAARLAREAEQRRREEEELRAKLARRAESRKASEDYPISTGHSFPGYKVVKHADLISVSAAVQVGRTGITTGELTRAMTRARREAMEELRIDAHEAGGNAVTGLLLECVTMEPESVNFSGGTLYEPYLVAVNATGNAVVIEAEEV